MATIFFMEMASIVQSTIEARVDRVISKLKENDVDAKAGDVILRNLQEYLLIKEYRKRKLESVQTSLSAFGFGPCPPPFTPPSGIPASTPSTEEQPFPPHRKTAPPS